MPGRGLGTGPGAALLVGGGDVAGGVVSATTGGCHVLLAARWARFLAVGHDGVGDAVSLARDRPRSVWVCVEGWVGKGTQHAAKWLREARLTRPTEGWGLDWRIRQRDWDWRIRQRDWDWRIRQRDWD